MKGQWFKKNIPFNFMPPQHILSLNMSREFQTMLHFLAPEQEGVM